MFFLFTGKPFGAGGFLGVAIFSAMCIEAAGAWL